jgi:hypothetical protein
MMWEDKVFHDPDGVDVDALFEDLHSDDERTQYEAAAGVYWLASSRPERVRPRADELLALTGDLPDFGLGESSSTRRWFAEGVAELVGAYPEQFVSPMVEQLASEQETTREDATRVLGFVANLSSTHDIPSQIREHRSEFVDLLDDPNETVRRNSLWTLAGIADEYPEAVNHLVTRVTPFLDQTTPDISAVLFVRRVAEESPEQVEPAVERLVDALSRLDTDDIGTAKTVLETLLTLADEYPEKVTRAEHDAARLARSDDSPVSDPATSLLTMVR